MYPRYNGTGMLKSVRAGVRQPGSINELLDLATKNYHKYLEWFETNYRLSIGKSIPIGDAYYASRFIAEAKDVQLEDPSSYLRGLVCLPNQKITLTLSKIAGSRFFNIDTLGFQAAGLDNDTMNALVQNPETITFSSANEVKIFTYLTKNFDGENSTKITQYKLNVRTGKFELVGEQLYQNVFIGAKWNVEAKYPFTFYQLCSDDADFVYPFQAYDNLENFLNYLYAETYQTLNAYLIDNLPTLNDVANALHLNDSDRLLMRIVADIATIKSRGGIYDTRAVNTLLKDEYYGVLGYYPITQIKPRFTVNGPVQYDAKFKFFLGSKVEEPKIHTLFTEDGFQYETGVVIKDYKFDGRRDLLGSKSTNHLIITDYLSIVFYYNFYLKFRIPAIASGGAKAVTLIVNTFQGQFDLSPTIIAGNDFVDIVYEKQFQHEIEYETNSVGIKHMSTSVREYSIIGTSGRVIRLRAYYRSEDSTYVITDFATTDYHYSNQANSFTEVQLQSTPKFTYQQPLIDINSYVTYTDLSLIEYFRTQNRINLVIFEKLDNLEYRLTTVEEATRPTIIGTAAAITQMISNFEFPIQIMLALATFTSFLETVDQAAKGQYTEAVVTSFFGTLSAFTSFRGSTSSGRVPQLEQDYTGKFATLVDAKTAVHRRIKAIKPDLKIGITKNNPAGAIVDTVQIRSSKIREFPGSGAIADYLNSHPDSKLTAWAKQRNLIPEHHFVQTNTTYEIEGNIYQNQLRLGVSDGVQSNRGNFNIGSTNINTGTLMSQPGFMFCPTILDGTTFRPIIIDDRLKQYRANLVMRGAKRSEVILLEEGALNKKYRTTFNAELNNTMHKFNNSNTNLVKSTQSTITAGEYSDIAKHFTSESFKSNWNYNLLNKNCQGYAQSVYDNLLGAQNPTKYLTNTYSKISTKTVYDSYNDYIRQINEIYDRIIAFAPGYATQD